MKNIFNTTDILLPKKNIDLTKWSVVACDQYTSQQDYWDSVSDYVSQSHSTLHMIFREIDLEKAGFDERITDINATMESYINEDIFDTLKDCYLYVERTCRDGRVREGIMGVVDLEEYDYAKDAALPIRATEGTVLSRIPPRVQIRRSAPLELPHIMLLIDDPDCDIVESVGKNLSDSQCVYDFPLMQDSGHIKGYALNKEQSDVITKKLLQYQSKEAFTKRYSDIDGIEDKPVLAYAVGDGNHSLATAKRCYEDLKANIGEAALSHPARFALTELVNLHSPSLEFEPIHRVLFNISPLEVVKELNRCFDLLDYDGNDSLNGTEQVFSYIIDEKVHKVIINNPTLNLSVGSITEFIDKLLLKHPQATVDYIHGEDVVSSLTKTTDTIGFIFDGMAKSDLFKTVILDSALPRKTFSMGHPWDKRFYLECRRIKG